MKQFFSYFKIVFIALGVLLIVTVVTTLTKGNIKYDRKNDKAPTQRVYDYAEVLTQEQEDELEKLIAKRENQIGCDIVLVTINESLYEKYGITEDTDANWERCITRYAEDFYQDNGFGYDEPGIDGDGALLLHNWYPDEKGSHLTHGGRVWEHYDDDMIGEVLDEVYYRALSNPYDAYRYYIEDMYNEMSGKGNAIPPVMILLCAVLVSGIFVCMHIKSKEGTKTTTETTYVENNSIKYNIKRDELKNKYVTSRVIPKSSSGGSGGGGGRSSGGSHMGGGSRRG